MLSLDCHLLLLLRYRIIRRFTKSPTFKLVPDKQFPDLAQARNLVNPGGRSPPSRRKPSAVSRSQTVFLSLSRRDNIHPSYIKQQAKQVKQRQSNVPNYPFQIPNSLFRLRPLRHHHSPRRPLDRHPSTAPARYCGTLPISSRS
jgi:hypothetical protein